MKTKIYIATIFDDYLNKKINRFMCKELATITTTLKNKST